MVQCLVLGNMSNFNNCGCDCEKVATYKVCDCVEKCIKKLEINIGVPNYTDKITILKKWSGLYKCYKFDFTTDANGIATIDIPKGFLSIGWTLKYEYILSIKDFEFDINGEKWCALSFCVTNCDKSLETQRIL
jgi:hypothetical protein